MEDELRMGGFRFQEPDSGAFISSTPSYSVPPVIQIDELLQAAKEIEKSEYKHLKPEKKWVQRLFQPGSSMGGARPKACVQKWRSSLSCQISFHQCTTSTYLDGNTSHI